MNECFNSVEKLGKKVAELEVVIEQFRVRLGDRGVDVDKRFDEVDSKLVINEMRLEDECKKLSERIDESVKKMAMLESRRKDFDIEWPVVSERDKANDKVAEQSPGGERDIRSVEISSENKVRISKDKESFSEKFKNRPRDRVVVLGDSLVRGIVSCLKKYSHLFDHTSIREPELKTLRRKLVS